MTKAFPTIAMVDCALETLAFECINQLVEKFHFHWTYHHPPSQGIKSLQRVQRPAAYLVLGSHSNVSDNLDWQQELAAFIKQEIEQGIPTLGICFGHQLIAAHFGADIEKVNSTNPLQEGVRQMKLARQLGPLPVGQELPMVVSHSYKITNLPDCFSNYEHDEGLSYDLITHREYPFWGTQGHPEASVGFVEKTLSSPLPQADYRQALAGGHTFIQAFLEHFALIRHI